jgi:hypothetical protein
MSLGHYCVSRRAAIGLALLGLVPVGVLPGAASAEGTLLRIPPGETDPRITRFAGADNWVIYNQMASPAAELLVFLPGTSRGRNGASFEYYQQFFQTATDAGYHVIALQYDNNPAVAQICPRQPDPGCAGAFREKRIFGDDVTPVIDDTPEESVVNRLTKLLELLVSRYPKQDWGRYLSNGAPNWGRLVVSGHSQGAGMAAFIAKREAVARVSLLSGPWDYSVPGPVPAPWLTMPSATPMDRWFAIRHAQERETAALAAAYADLEIPPDHIRVLNLPPTAPGGFDQRGDAYHLSVVGDRMTPRLPDGRPAYRADWAFLLGHSP